MSMESHSLFRVNLLCNLTHFIDSRLRGLPAEQQTPSLTLFFHFMLGYTYHILWDRTDFQWWWWPQEQGVPLAKLQYKLWSLSVYQHFGQLQEEAWLWCLWQWSGWALRGWPVLCLYKKQGICNINCKSLVPGPFWAGKVKGLGMKANLWKLDDGDIDQSE